MQKTLFWKIIAFSKIVTTINICRACETQCLKIDPPLRNNYFIEIERLWSLPGVGHTGTFFWPRWSHHLHPSNTTEIKWDVYNFRDVRDVFLFLMSFSFPTPTFLSPTVALESRRIVMNTTEPIFGKTVTNNKEIRSRMSKAKRTLENLSSIFRSKERQHLSYSYSYLYQHLFYSE